MTIRAVVAVGLALLVAAQVVRTAAVRALGETSPASAARLWPTHPDVQLSLALTEIAAATRDGRPVSPAVFQSVASASRKAPLAPEPFLVRGVQAQVAGNLSLAERAFVEARWRDGRSLPARYFLAEHYLRQREAAKGLREIVALTRLIPGGELQLAPYVARYAHSPANQDQLRALFRTEPSLEHSVLATLAADARNADLIVALSNPQRRSSKSPWLPALLESLVADRQYSKAREIWATVSRVRPDPREIVFDPHFTRPDEPPPFNWTLTSSTVGLAERQRGGGLHVLYYGQEDGPLASQLLVLPGGTYRLGTKAAGAARADSLRWTLVCATTNAPIASVPLRNATGGWRFRVPGDCAAQRLELAGVSSEAPQQVDVTIQSISLARENPDG